ncbi:hypothetical protein ABPG74_009098 [Tetrahymena malaccensis]
MLQRSLAKFLLRNTRQTFGVVRNGFSSTQIEKAAEKSEDVPIHLRPYNKEKYEVPSTKLKYSTGYALLDVEPMPRAKIMKISYNILHKLKEIPETAMYRIYTEEKVKYIMKLTDEIEDVRQLEEEFGQDSIELFIYSYGKELELVEYMKHSKPWESRAGDEEQNEMIRIASQKRVYLKHQRVDRPARQEAAFISSNAKPQLEAGKQ